MTVYSGCDAAATPNMVDTQDFEDTGFGGVEPLAMIGQTGFGTAIGNLRPDITAGFGFAGGNTTSTTNQFAAAISGNNAEGTTICKRYFIDGDAVFLRLAPNDGSIRAEANWQSWDTDKVTVRWGDPDNQTTRRCHAILLGDDNQSAETAVGTFTPNATEDASTDVTSHGFVADVIFFTGVFSGSADTTEDDARIFFGIYVKDGAKNGCFSWYSEDAVGTTNVENILSTDRVCVELTGSGSAGAGVEISDIASGFRATTRDGAGTNLGTIGYLAVKYGTRVEQDLVVYDVPTSTGTDATTGVAFQPEHMLTIGSHVSAVDTIKTNGEAVTFSLGHADAAGGKAMAFSDEDNVGTTNTRSSRDDVAHMTIDYPLGTQTAQTATLSSFDSGGFTLGWIAAPLSTAGKSLAYVWRTIPPQTQDIPAHVAQRISRKRLIRM